MEPLIFKEKMAFYRKMSGDPESESRSLGA